MIDDALFAALLAAEGFDEAVNTLNDTARNASNGATTPPAEITEELTEKSLTSLQQGLVFWQMLHPQSAAYTVSRVWQVQFPSTTERQGTERGSDVVPLATLATPLTAGLQNIAQQQPSLRARIEPHSSSEKPIFKFNAELSLALVDLRNQPLNAAEQTAQQLAQAHSETALPITEYLCRVTIIALPDNRWQLGADFHHLITDAWSGDLWAQQLTHAFSHLISPEAEPQWLPFIPVFPADDLSINTQQNDRFSDLPNNWQQALNTLLPAQKNAEDLLHGDLPRPTLWTAKGQQYRRAIPQRINTMLHDFSRSQRCSLFQPLLGIWMHACATLRDNSALPMLCAFAQAYRPAASEDSINCWINTKVALLTDIKQQTFTQCLAQLAQTAASTTVNLVELIHCANPVRHANQQALSHLHFNIEINDGYEPAQPLDEIPPTTSKVQLTDLCARFDLSLDVYLNGQDGEWIVGYRSELFSEAFIEGLLQHVEQLIDCACREPNTPIQAHETVIKRISSLSQSTSFPSQQVVQQFTEKPPRIVSNNAALTELSSFVGLRDCLAHYVQHQLSATASSDSHNSEHSQTTGLQHCLNLLQTGADISAYSWFSLGLDSRALLCIASRYNRWLEEHPLWQKTSKTVENSNTLTPIPLANFYHSPTIGYFIEHFAHF